MAFYVTAEKNQIAEHSSEKEKKQTGDPSARKQFRRQTKSESKKDVIHHQEKDGS